MSRGFMPAAARIQNLYVLQKLKQTTQQRAQCAPKRNSTSTTPEEKDVPRPVSDGADVATTAWPRASAAARGAWWSVSRSPPQPAASRRPPPRLSPAAANAAAATPVKSVGELDGDGMADAIRDVDIACANAEGGGGWADRKGVGQVNPIAATAAATTIAAADAAAGA